MTLDTPVSGFVARACVSRVICGVWGAGEVYGHAGCGDRTWRVEAGLERAPCRPCRLLPWPWPGLRAEITYGFIWSRAPAARGEPSLYKE